MSDGALASQWFRLAGMAPRLRMHVRVHRQVARGEIFYVLQDEQTGRFFRISEAANLMLCLMNGRRTMEEIWRIVSAKLGAERPTKEEAIQLLMRLHQADLLRSRLPADMAEMSRRADRLMRKRWYSWFASPLAMRFPLFDPDRFLEATLPVVRPFFSCVGFAFWIALILTGAVLAAVHAEELLGNISDRVFSADNIAMIALLYVVGKALHEFAHAYATKIGGGEVHEMGVMLLVFFPVPYVDASAASAFGDRWRRILVSGAGIMVELALAALAIIAWVVLPPGLLRAGAFNLALLCGVSTLIFNGNPLLRFDGYYILGDLLGILNLDQRSKRHLLYLIQRYGFGIHDAEALTLARGEAKWLVGYGVSAFLYRMFLMVVIAVLVATQFFAIGVMIAGYSIFQMTILPLARGAHALLTGRRFRSRRKRAVAIVGAVATASILALTVVPAPYAVVAQGVLWVPDDAILRARANGFVSTLLAEPGSEVRAGQPLIRLEDPTAVAQLAVARAQLEVARSHFEAVNLIDLAEARLAAEQLKRAQADLERMEERNRELLVVARGPGRLAVPDRYDLVGRYVTDGDVLGYVIGEGEGEIRAVVPQEDIDLVRERTASVSVRFTEDISAPVAVEILRQTPSPLDRPPAVGLAAEAGGPMLLDPTSRDRRPLSNWYEFTLRVGAGHTPRRIGSRVFVRFDLGMEPVGVRIVRGLRQSLMRLAGV